MGEFTHHLVAPQSKDFFPGNSYGLQPEYRAAPSVQRPRGTATRALLLYDLHSAKWRYCTTTNRFIRASIPLRMRAKYVPAESPLMSTVIRCNPVSASISSSITRTS